MKIALFLVCILCSITKGQDHETTIYTFVEHMPRFSYCKDSTAIDYKALKSCSDQALLHYVYSNLDFPDFNLDEIWTDRIILSFIVFPSGRIGSIDVLKSIHPIADAAVVQLFQEMPSWIPGKQGLKTVPVKIILPMRFRFRE